MKIKCGEQQHDIMADNVYYSAQDCDCELCGSHGWVRMSFTCPACNKEHTIHLSDW